MKKNHYFHFNIDSTESNKSIESLYFVYIIINFKIKISKNKILNIRYINL